MEAPGCRRAYSERRQCSSCVETPRYLLSSKPCDLVMDRAISRPTSNLFSLSLFQAMTYETCCNTETLVAMIPRNMLNVRMKIVNGIKEDGFDVT